jgi:hypothetical protein
MSKESIITNCLILTCLNDVISVLKLSKNIFILIALFIAHIQVPLRSRIDSLFPELSRRTINAHFGTFPTREQIVILLPDAEGSHVDA